jgi:hypothetical protein
MATPDAATMRKLQSQGKAVRNAQGNPSFPIRNGGDLDNAIRAVGRVRPNTGAARSKVRRYIISRAKALGLTSKIPDSWAGDGSLKDGGDDSSSSGTSSSRSGSTAASKRVDPDHDGDNDATPAGDTDHDYWTKGGRQKKSLPGKPLSPTAQRIFARKKAA